MTTKLTLTIEDSVINAAKLYAKEKGRSLSDIVENYLKALSKKAEPEEKLSPRLKRLRGAISLPPDFDYKEELSKRLAEKYLK